VPDAAPAGPVDAHPRHRASFASPADLEEFVTQLERFERGEIGPDEWRGFRLTRGVYGQRQDGDLHMLRVKIPQGVLSTAQLHVLADVADGYSRGFGHITTRQNLQFHFMRLRDAELCMERLARAGLTTREACGNSIRNITACPYAGVAADERYDVSPYAEALTRYLLRHPLGALPRKFKIAFEGCPEDHAVTAINDIGLRARLRVNGAKVKGFQVLVGGGTSILCRSGGVLEEFLPADELLNAVEAIIRVYHRLGDYEHKKRNRLRFLIEQLGLDGFRSEYLKELRAFRAGGGAALPFDPQDPPVEAPPPRPAGPAPSLAEVAERAEASKLRGPGLLPLVRPSFAGPAGEFVRWRKTNVAAQKQPGYSMVTVTVVLGDLTGQQMRILGDLARAYGDGEVRVTTEQDLVFRWVHDGDVEALHRRLAAAGLGLPDARTAADVTSCPGAESCRLAVTQSRGLGQRLGDLLRHRPDLVAAVGELQIKISGCPNGCGQHHIAGIGFQGSVRRLGSRVAPQYFVLLGGGLDAAGARFGRLAAKVPARRLEAVLERLIDLYREERQADETATDFFARVDLARARDVLADLETLTPDSARPDDYVDLGDEQEFRMEVMDGECSA
jgi:sulfite reductase beta subunit-like hemoprotein